MNRIVLILISPLTRRSRVSAEYDSNPMSAVADRYPGICAIQSEHEKRPCFQFHTVARSSTLSIGRLNESYKHIKGTGPCFSLKDLFCTARRWRNYMAAFGPVARALEDG